MQAFVDFIQAYFPYLSAGIMILIEVLSIILKKRPKTLDDFNYALKKVSNFVPQFIVEVEEPGKGAVKLEKVIDSCFGLLERLLGRELSVLEDNYAFDYFSNYVEAILATPQKKGVLNESKS